MESKYNINFIEHGKIYNYSFQDVIEYFKNKISNQYHILSACANLKRSVFIITNPTR